MVTHLCCMFYYRYKLQVKVNCPIRFSSRQEGYTRKHILWKNLTKLLLIGDIPKKILNRLAQQSGVCASSARKTAKLLNLRPWKTTVVRELYDTDCEARLGFANWYLHVVHSACLVTKLGFISVDV